MRLVYLHGFASGPTSRKARFFGDRFASRGQHLEVPDLTPPPEQGGFSALTITGQLQVVENLLRGEPCVLIGSSMGGYIAAIYASHHPEVARLVLQAPAFCFARRFREVLGPAQVALWKAAGVAKVFHHVQNAEAGIGYQLLEDADQYPDYPAVSQTTLVLHGIQDEVVPVDLARTFVAANPGRRRLVEYAAPHDLTNCMDEMWREVAAFLSLHP
jgi:pimeloyl-ACP methyl ester carboxylesterase